jgi:lipopolysaccharide biosynthesis glycosyltransferase
VASLVIACASDSRCALPLAVMLRTVVANLDPCSSVDVYAVDDGIDPADKARVQASLNDRVTLRWVRPCTSALGNLPMWGRMPITTYQKLTLGEWLPAEVEKVIWLDCDLLVLHDIAPLWCTDLGDRQMFAVPDQRVPFVSSRFGVAAYRELGLAPEAKYFNAGVLLIDVGRWRRDDVAGRAAHYLKTYRDRVFFWDQEALNAVLAGQWGELDAAWNHHPTIDHLLGREVPPKEGRGADGISHDIRIAHFSGNLKPWNSQGSSPYHTLYFRYLDQTAWTGWRPARTFTGTMLQAYESSRLRRLVYPAEQWATHLMRTLTRSHDGKGETA